MTSKFRLKGLTAEDEFQVQRLSGKSTTQATMITLSTKRKAPIKKLSMPTRGHRYSKKKGLRL